MAEKLSEKKRDRTETSEERKKRLGIRFENWWGANPFMFAGAPDKDKARLAYFVGVADGVQMVADW